MRKLKTDMPATKVPRRLTHKNSANLVSGPTIVLLTFVAIVGAPLMTSTEHGASAATLTIVAAPRDFTPLIPPVASPIMDDVHEEIADGDEEADKNTNGGTI